MSKIFVILLMIFFHIIDDFFLQIPWLSNGKQKTWWQKNAPDPKYQYDFWMALLIHSFSWAFMTMLPIGFFFRFDIGTPFLFFIVINTSIHLLVDHLKANKFKLNLIQDQSIHIVQILFTAFLLLP